jgi:hypothetical protein
VDGAAFLKVLFRGKQVFHSALSILPNNALYQTEPQQSPEQAKFFFTCHFHRPMVDSRFFPLKILKSLQIGICLGKKAVSDAL